MASHSPVGNDHWCYHRHFHYLHSAHKRVPVLSVLIKELLKGFEEPHDVVVLGSGRATQLSSELLGESSFFNHSVSAAALEDILAIYQFRYQTGSEPQKVILNIDPWIFNHNNPSSAWMSVQDDYERALSRLGLDQSQVRSTGQQVATPTSLRRWGQLLSIEYLRNSLQIIAGTSPNLATDNRNNIVATEIDGYTDWYVKRYDGSVLYSKNLRNISPEEVAEDTRKKLNERHLYGLSNFDRIDPNAKLQFEAFVSDLTGRGITVEIFLSPYNPIFYQEMESNEKYRNVLEVELYLHSLAEKQQFLIMGSYDPHKYGCGQEDFIDEHHPRTSCLEKILNNQ